MHKAQKTQFLYMTFLLIMLHYYLFYNYFYFKYSADTDEADKR